MPLDVRSRSPNVNVIILGLVTFYMTKFIIMPNIGKGKNWYILYASNGFIRYVFLPDKTNDQY